MNRDSGKIIKACATFAGLAAAYFVRHGGVRALPGLAGKVLATLRTGGLHGLGDEIRNYRNRISDLHDNLSPLAEILNGESKVRELLSKSFCGRKSVLIIDHMYGGGANSYREARVRELNADGNAVLVATWAFYSARLVLTAFLPDTGNEYRFHAGCLEDLIDQSVFRFDRIIVNNLMLWSSPEAPQACYRNLPALLQVVIRLKDINSASLEFDLHDYYAICPSCTLVNDQGKFCDIPEDLAECRRCLKKLPTWSGEDPDLSQWRAAWQKLIANATEIRAFADSPLRYLRKVYDIPEHKCRVIPHKPLSRWQAAYSPPVDAPMRIAIIGEINRHKGAGIVRQLASLLNDDESMVVIGTIDCLLPARVAVHGRYTREELPDLVSKYKPTVALIPSIWPETFCYTAQECELLGLPTVAFPLGAQGERMAKSATGQVANEISATSALKALRELDARRECPQKEAQSPSSC